MVSFWRFALSFVALISLVDVVSDILAVIALGKSKEWTALSLTLISLIGCSLLVAYYEAKEFSSRSSKIIGVILSVFQLGVLYAALRAVFAKTESPTGDKASHFRAVRLLELMFEAVPQFTIQAFVALKRDELAIEGGQTYSEVIYKISIIISLIQMATFFCSLELNTRAWEGFSQVKKIGALVNLWLFRFGELGSRLWLVVIFSMGFGLWIGITVLILEGLLFLVIKEASGRKFGGERSRTVAAMGGGANVKLKRKETKDTVARRNSSAPNSTETPRVSNGDHPELEKDVDGDGDSNRVESPKSDVDTETLRPETGRSDATEGNGEPGATMHRKCPSGEPDLIDSDIYEKPFASATRSPNMYRPFDREPSGKSGNSTLRKSESHREARPEGSWKVDIGSQSMSSERYSGGSSDSNGTPMFLSQLSMSFGTGPRALQEVGLTVKGVGARIYAFAVGATPAMGKGDVKLLAIGLPIFYVSDATGRNLLGYSTGLYDTINGDGLSNLKKGLIDARVYFFLRFLSQIYLSLSLACGNGTCLESRAGGKYCLAGPNWPNLDTSQDRGCWTSSDSLALSLVLLLFHTIVMWLFLLMKALLYPQLVESATVRSNTSEGQTDRSGLWRLGRRKSKEEQRATEFNVYMNDLTSELANGAHTNGVIVPSLQAGDENGTSSAHAAGKTASLPTLPRHADGGCQKTVSMKESMAVISLGAVYGNGATEDFASPPSTDEHED
mmetsp:Transcript_5544/g.20214  ORF Transcript_5544/g.20214 Transcript_5544/m.20214 type:complete len:730 (-) Transcript_5544:47-2236(-)